MEIIKSSQIDEYISKALQGKDTYVLAEYEEDVVSYGVDENPNFEYCVKHNLRTTNLGRRGGVFFIKKGDIAFGSIAKGLNNEPAFEVRDKLLQFLKAKGLNATADGNDIMIDNTYKVFGWSSHYFHNLDKLFIVCHFTMSVDLNTIKNVCPKPMIKIPKGLNDYGITTEDIKNLFLRFEEKYK